MNPMEEIIIFNECSNADGRHIHLYRNKETGLWAAYGYSAYKVATMECHNDIPTVKSYSQTLLMPVVILDKDACRQIATLYHKEELTADYIRLSISEPRSVDTDNYRNWAQQLRDTLA